MKFTHSHTDRDGRVLETVTIETNEGNTLDEALETFERFLKAVGYTFEGSIIIEESQQPLSDDFDQGYNTDGEDVDPEHEESIDVFSEEVDIIDWPFPKNSKP